jgi:hypothetical protein
MKALKTLVVTAALALGVAAGGTAPAGAFSGSDAWLACSEGAGTALINLPVNAPARWSIYAYRIDGGAWQWSTWYYLDGANYSYWTGSRLASIPYGAIAQMPYFNVGGNHLFQAWEYRYDRYGRSMGRVNLGSCRTVDFGGNWMIIR